MKPSCTIATIMAVHNGSRYLQAALETVIAQSVPRSEIVVVDDGSTDDTATIVASFGSRIILVQQEQRGPGAARNTGITKTSSELLNFVDADDLCPLTRNESLRAPFMDDPLVMMAAGQILEFISEELSPEEKRRFSVSEVARPGHVIGGVMIRRELFEQLGLFHEELKVAEFMDFYMSAQQAQAPSKEVPELVLRRRVHGENHSLKSAHLRETEFPAVIRKHMLKRRAPDQ